MLRLSLCLAVLLGSQSLASAYWQDGFLPESREPLRYRDMVFFSDREPEEVASQPSRDRKVKRSMIRSKPVPGKRP